MLQIKALNDESSRNGDELTEIKESEEEKIFALYNESLNQYLNQEYEEAASGMEQVLASPLLNGQGIPQSPLHKQIRLGCLKNLSQIYMNFPEPDYEAAKTKTIQTIEMDETVVNWLNLGQIGLKLLDYGLATEAFSQAHLTSPGHWDPIENLITLNFVLADYRTCLQFCSIGLDSDSSFVKAQVFRDLCLDADPDLKDLVQTEHPEWKNLFAQTLPTYDLSWKEKFQGEARGLTDKYRQSIRAQLHARQMESQAAQPHVFTFNPSTFAQLIQNILTIKAFVAKHGFGKKFSISWSGKNANSVNVKGSKCDEDGAKDLHASEPMELCQGTQEDLNGRSKSPSEEPDIQTGQKDAESFCDTNTQEIAEDSLGLSNPSADFLSKKKNKKDVKWWQLEGKRRSQRVRGLALPISSQCGAKRDLCFSEMLKKIIPPSLLYGECNGHSEELHSKREKKTAKVALEYFGSAEEAADVEEFLASSNSTDFLVLTIDLFNFLVNKKFEIKWPTQLIDEFLKLSAAYRSFIVRTDPNFCPEEESEVRMEGLNTLRVVEVLLDRLNLVKFESPKVEKALRREMEYLIQLSFNPLLLTDEFQARFYWFRGNFALHLAKSGKAEYCDAGAYFQAARVHLELLGGSVAHPGISVADVEAQLGFIERMENIERTKTLHEEGNHEELIAILAPYLKSVGEPELRNRSYLTQAYALTGRKEEALSEALLFLRFSVGEPEMQREAVGAIEKLLTEVKLSQTQAQSLADSVLNLLTHMEKKAEFSPTLTSLWLLMHQVLFAVEQSEPALFLDEEAVPNSVLLLSFAHECLARMEKCVCEGGRLLRYVVNTLAPLMDKEEYGGHDETRFCLEQAFYCLYAHPGKKAKLKHLSDHGNTGGTELAWPDCPVLFHYYKPKELPEFDSYDSISSDQENLFRRILAAMPKELRPNPPPDSPKALFDQLADIQLTNDKNMGLAGFHDIYYLLGDHYFKAKEFAKAMDFYFLDLSVVPRRFDSWACIALATAELVNTQLNSFDDFHIEDIMSNANIVVLAFQNALTLDQSNSKVRIEFGSFVYSMDSFCSRLLKYNSDRLSLDQFQVVEGKKDEFIGIAAECFQPILPNYGENDEGEHQDEIWIHHYMLGKVLEKIHPGNPEKFLEQYEIAAALLHLQEAPYPLKINYYNAPELAIEALEIYYRIHASALAYVQKHEYNEEIENVLLKHLKTSAESPFVQARVSRSVENMEAKKKKSFEETSKREQKIIESLVEDLIRRVENEENGLDSNVAGGEDGSCPQSSLALRARTKKVGGGKGRRNEEGRANGRPPLKKTPSLDAMEVDVRFKDVKFGKVVYECVKALEECISRFPQHHKSYYRIALAFTHFLKDWNKGREYLLGTSEKDKRVMGLFGDRKPNNFFNGVLRNPSDDIDRPGSFPYHMSKAVQHMLEILNGLDDHQMLAEVGIHFSKLPDLDKKYLYNFEREQFSQQAFSSCLAASKRFLDTSQLDYKLVAISIFETYLKMQKFNPKENPLSGILITTAKMAILKRGEIAPVDVMTCEQAFKSLQYLSWTVGTSFGKHGKSQSAQNSTKRGLQNEKKKVSLRELGGNGMMPDGSKSTLGPKLSKKKFPTGYPSLLNPELMLSNEMMRSEVVGSVGRLGLDLKTSSSLYLNAQPSSNPMDPPKAPEKMKMKKKRDFEEIPSSSGQMLGKGDKPSSMEAKKMKISQMNLNRDFVQSKAMDSVSAMLNLFLGSNPKVREGNLGSPLSNLGSFLDASKPKSVPTSSITQSQIEKAFLSSMTAEKFEQKGQEVRKTPQMGNKRLAKVSSGSSVSSPTPSLKGKDKTEEFVKISSTYTALTNTSPFKGQLNFLTSPTEFCRNKNSGQEVNFMTPPPKAHSNPRSCKPKAFPNEENPDVIDLTVKTPSPEKKAPSISQQERFEHSGFEKETRNYPLPPKKKHRELFEAEKRPSTPTRTTLPNDPKGQDPKPRNSPSTTLCNEVIYLDD